MPRPIALYRTFAPYAGVQRKCIIYLTESISNVLDLIEHTTALKSAPTIWVFYPQDKGATQVPSTIVYEPSDVALPSISGTQSYQIDRLDYGVDFINFFRQANEATAESDSIVWNYPTGQITIPLGYYLATDHNGHVWAMDSNNFQNWLNNG